jgi:hypothetical protein
MNNDYLGTPADTIAIANAIARTEGFFTKGTIPQVHNNPGDIENAHGQKMVFATESDGWDALYRQIELMITGRSRIYKPTMTWIQIGSYYDGEKLFMDWVSNVTKVLGVEPSSTLGEFIANFGKPKATPIGLTFEDTVDFADKVNNG